MYINEHAERIMWIKPLRPMTGVYGRVRAKVPVNLPDEIAGAMIEQQKAVPCQSPAQAKAALREDAKKAVAGPTKTSLTGGQDGEEKPSSSSRADRAPAKKKKTYTRLKDERASSRSTKAGS